MSLEESAPRTQSNLSDTLIGLDEPRFTSDPQALAPSIAPQNLEGLDGAVGLGAIPDSLDVELSSAAPPVAAAPTSELAGATTRSPPPPLDSTDDVRADDHAVTPASAIVRNEQLLALPAKRRILPLLANSLSGALLVAIAFALFLGWRSSSASRLPIFGRESMDPVMATGVHGGLYDTRFGSPVLVVRGEVAARRAVSGAIRIEVELLEGDRIIASSAGLAGASASPEEVHAAGTREQVTSLRAALDAKAIDRLLPGETAPFIVVFPPPIPEGKRLDLRVTAEPLRALSRSDND